MRRQTIGRGFATIAVIGSLGLATAMVGLEDDGIAGYSGNPNTNGGATCTQCHSGGTAPTVTLFGPSHVIAGRTYQFELRMGGGQQDEGGFDVSVTDGTLVPTDPDTEIKSGEVVHSNPRNADGNGEIAWMFDWVAPSSAGSTTMYGVGNSTNGGGLGGDNDDTDVVNITTATCDNLVMDINPESVIPGQTLTFDACGSIPNGLGLLVASEINGTPLFLKLFFFPFNGSGEWSLPLGAPGGLGGTEVGFAVVGLDATTGKPAFSNTELVFFE